MQSLFATIEGNPDKADEQNNGGNEAAQVAEQGILPGDGGAIGADNLHPNYHHPGRLPAPCPRANEIGNVYDPGYENGYGKKGRRR